MAEKGVKLYGTKANPFCLVVEWALKVKGIEYEYIAEEHNNLSPDVLKYNPVYKKVPILLHDGRPVLESLVIIEYIEDTWKGTGPSLLSENPYEKAASRFLAKFAEDKLVPAVYTALLKVGEEHKKAAEEVKECLTLFEKALNRKGTKFFGGDCIGHLDIAIGWVPYWLKAVKDVVGYDGPDEGKLQDMRAWGQNLLCVDVIKGSLPPFDVLVEKLKKHREETLACAAH